MWLGRGLRFLSVALFVVFWAWFFIKAIGAGQYLWAFLSLLLFALFMFASAVMPRGRASSMEIVLAWAKLFVNFEAEIGTEAFLDKVKAVIPEEAKKAVEKAKPQLVEEARRTYERAAALAVASTATAQTSGVAPSGLAWSLLPPTLTPEDLEDPTKYDAFRAAIERRLRRGRGLDSVQVGEPVEPKK